MQDGLLKLLGQARGEGFFGLTGFALAVQVRATHVDHIGQWLAPAFVHVRQTGEAGGGEGGAVIAALARDQPMLARFADGGVVVAHELDRGIDRLGAGTLEHHLVQPLGGVGDQLGSEVGGRAVAAVGEGLLVRQLEHLRMGGLGQARLAETQGRAPEPGHALDVALTVFVEHVDAFATLDHQRADLLVQAEVGLGVKVIGDITLGQCRALGIHGRTSSC
ncbi:hypothetical protein D3C73_1174990 [compost metagenome]